MNSDNGVQTIVGTVFPLTHTKLFLKCIETSFMSFFLNGERFNPYATLKPALKLTGQIQLTNSEFADVSSKFLHGIY